ncbi:hypothetical protein FACS189454_04940 [Planctomycetales bacterium]|nr:hypothetical protein FACS189454_04940 [Planctomycetales bacterium]
MSQTTAPINAPADGAISTEAVIKSITSGADQAADTPIDSVVETITNRMSAKPATEQSIKSAIEGKLVAEGIIPETNQKVLEAIDTNTGRYPPRLKVDFVEFPLRILANNEEILFDAELKHETGNDIETRIRECLQVPNIYITFKNRTAIITGRVRTLRQRSLIETMLRIEPGIDTVQNNLTVKTEK